MNSKNLTKLKCRSGKFSCRD